MKPFVIVNCAMSIDGKIALPARKQIKISNEEDIERVHKLRNECDAVLVGIGTVLADDPKLTVKKKYVPNPSNPLRIVLDSNFRAPGNAEVMKGNVPTLIVTTRREFKRGNLEVIKCGHNTVNLKKLMKLLYDRGIKKLLVEGGETVIWEFLKQGLVDELNIFMAPFVIGGITSPTMAGGEGSPSPDKIIHMELHDFYRIGNGILLKFRPSLSENMH
ncbi:MAG: 2,5-diamino-6-(ribosylamino)-4(3H)-pyrimidinone 5'-phosphate reductase [Candidatus Thermoplasmatota archaeon]|nr:2,5-diamino-6-(ribosylamino)-4(3H)-pyrimidinone 5'-phosphate reductase [Candidatus Thermoplasmatota archaeon]